MTITLPIINTLAKGSAKFIKKDAETMAVLAGAVFTLYHLNAEAQIYEEVSTGHTTDVDGLLTLADLLPGKYKLVETQAPPDHYYDDPQEVVFEIKLDADGKIIPLQDITITNLPYVELRIIKIDSDNNKIVLPGAVFKLVMLVPRIVVVKSSDDPDDDDEIVIVERIVSDEDGCCTFCNLKRGKYKLIEIQAPYGYLLPQKPETIIYIPEASTNPQ